MLVSYLAVQGFINWMPFVQINLENKKVDI